MPLTVNNNNIDYWVNLHLFRTEFLTYFFEYLKQKKGKKRKKLVCLHYALYFLHLVGMLKL
jgi:hypothetical protein